MASLRRWLRRSQKFAPAKPRRLELEVLEGRTLPAVVRWINPVGGDWSTAANWDMGRIPRADDDVRIEVPGNYTVTYAIPAGQTEIQSLFSTQAFTIANGTLSVNEKVDVSNQFRMTGGLLQRATLAAGTTLTAQSGTVTLRDVTLRGNLTLEGNANVTLADNWRNEGIVTVNGGTLSLGGTFGLDTLGKLQRNAGIVRIMGTLDNRGGTLALGAATGSWQLGGLLLGGTVTTADGFALDVIANGGRMTGVTVHGTLNVGGTLTVEDGLTVHGRVNVAQPPNTGGSLTFTGANRQLAGTCVVEFSANFQSSISSAPEPVYLGAGVTVRGGSVVLRNVVSYGVIEVSSAAAQVSFDGDRWRNDGQVRLSNGSLGFRGNYTAASVGDVRRTGGIVTLGGTYDNTGQVLTLNAATGSWLLAGTIRGGVVRATEGAALLTQGNNGFGQLDGVTLETDLTLLNNYRLAFTGAWSNRATVTIGGGSVELGGTFTTADLGTLRNQGGAIRLVGILDNTNRTLTLDDATGSWGVERGTIRGGTVTTTGPARLNFLISLGTLDGVTVNGTIVVNASGSSLMTVRNGLTLNGVLELASNTAGAPGVSFAGTQTFQGSAQVRFTGPSTTGGVVGATTGGIVTFGPGIAVPGGRGRFANFLNQGTMFLPNATDVLAFSGTWRNEGVLALGEGRLTLGGTFAFADVGDLRRTGGTVFLSGTMNNANSTFTLNAATGSWALSAGTIVGGTFRTQDGSQLLFGTGTGRLNGVTIESPITVPSSASLFIEGAWRNRSTVTVSGGSLTLLDSGTNEGTWAVSAGTLIFAGSNTTAAFGKVQRTGGTVRLAGTFNNTGSTLALDANTGSWEFSGRIVGGTVTTADGVQLVASGGSSALENVTVHGDVRAFTAVFITGGFTLNGTLALRSTFQFRDAQTLSGKATILLDSTSARLWNSNNVVTLAPTVTVRGWGVLENVRNLGTIEADTESRVLSLRGNWSNEGQLHLSAGTLGLAGTFTTESLAGFTRTGGAVSLIGTLNNTGAALNLDSKLGAWQLNGGTIRGGTVAVAAGGGLVFTNTTSTLHDIILYADLTLAANQRVTVSGASILKGNVTVAGGALTFSNGAWTNQGVLRLQAGTVSLGGTFTLAALGDFRRTGGTVTLAGRLENTGGTLTLDDTTGTWLMRGGRIVGGAVVINGSANLTLSDTNALDGVTLFGVLDLASGSTTISGGLTLQGTLRIGRVGATTLRFSGTQTVGGKGTIELVNLNNAVHRLQAVSANETWILGPGVTLRGARATLTNVVNQGLIEVLPASIGVTFFGDSWRNDGVIVLSNGTVNFEGSYPASAIGTLKRTGGMVRLGGTMDNTGNNLVLNAATGSWVLISGTVVGGTITGTEGATLLPGGGAVLNGVTLAADVTVTSGLSFTGNWSNRGILRQASGTLSLGGTFTLAALGDYRYVDGLVHVTGTLDNTGTTLALSAATGSWQLVTGTIRGGTVTTADNARLLVRGGTFSRLIGVTLSGRLDVEFGSAVRISEGLTLHGEVRLGRVSGWGALYFEGSQTLDGTGTISFFGNDGPRTGLALITSDATLTIGPGITVRGGAGTIGFMTGAPGGAVNLHVVNQGVIRAGGRRQTVTVSAAEILNAGTLEVAAGATLALDRRGAVGAITNLGTVLVGSHGLLTANVPYVQLDGNTVLAGGTIRTPQLYMAGGVLSGAGVIDGDLFNAALLTVGGDGAAGWLDVSGHFEQVAGGRLVMELGGTQPGEEHDYLSVGGTATLGGTLDVRLLDGYFADPGDMFTLLTFGSAAAFFDEIEGLFPKGPVFFEPTLDEFGLTLTALPN